MRALGSSSKGSSDNEGRKLDILRRQYDAKRFVKEADEENGASDESRDFRTPFQHDRDRILYSGAFRRLAGVTQVVAVSEQRLVHNRLTHSLKVAQIARRMAERLTKMSDFKTDLVESDFEHLPDIAEAASLAHDIGHPPFGHIAEGVLNGLMKDLGGFEGNAQSLRIVSKVAVRTAQIRGLNLTRATLNAILKYPRLRQNVPPQSDAPAIPWTERSRGRKWGAYSNELKEFRFARNRPKSAQLPVRAGQESWPAKEVRSVAAILMDWADDISYATHDIDDYFCAGLIPLHKLKNQAEQEDFLEYLESVFVSKNRPWGDQCRAELGQVIRFLPDAEYRDSREDMQTVGQFVTSQIRYLVGAVAPTGDRESPFVQVDPLAQHRVELLKQLNWMYVIETPALALAQAGQQRIIRDLFDALSNKLAGKPSTRSASSTTPRVLQDIYDEIAIEEAEKKGPWTPTDERIGRAVCDYICWLTEDQTLDLYERITGTKISRSSIFGTWFY